MPTELRNHGSKICACFKTTSHKPYLEKAPYLIAIFYQLFHRTESGEKKRCYYPKESTGIATGMLITALHNCGLGFPYPHAFANVHF